jgi:heme-degrading monooxygenase HmoA
MVGPGKAVEATSTFSTRGTEMIHQLRIYEIFEANKAVFHARFRDHAARIMRRHGFQIVVMWEAKTDDRTEFVYLLRWPDEQAKEQAWTAFMADEEWESIKRTTRGHGDLVGGIEDRILTLTDYSPVFA